VPGVDQVCGSERKNVVPCKSQSVRMYRNRQGDARGSEKIRGQSRPQSTGVRATDRPARRAVHGFFGADSGPLSAHALFDRSYARKTGAEAAAIISAGYARLTRTPYLVTVRSAVLAQHALALLDQFHHLVIIIFR
jgi:hypothetical protein